MPTALRTGRGVRPRQRRGRPRRAVDGGWSVTGQKVWTSGAGSSDFALLVARTDPGEPRHAGLSCFALDMHAPGVEVRPLRQMSGAYHFNEVFLDDVFVPETDLVGPLGAGWTVLRTMLASERAAIGGGTSARSAVQLLALADQLGRAGEPVVRQWLAAAYTRERLLDLVRMRMTDPAAVPAGGPLSKLLYSEHAATQRRHRDQDPRSRRHAHRRCRRRTLGRAAPLRARAPHRWWHRRDPAQRHRRARAGTPTRADTTHHSR